MKLRKTKERKKRIGKWKAREIFGERKRTKHVPTSFFTETLAKLDGRKKTGSLTYLYAYYTNTHTYTRTHVHTYTRTHVHTYTRTHVHTYTRTHVHTYTRTHVHTYTRTHVHTYTVCTYIIIIRRGSLKR
ncbi:hypothetical protein WN51_11984 [Melipona quadrifasciata]|uniref:Uncharacterized protein n=1 Tax=Melipona quadrifasciata TaxID=166423 RepID=A0A0M9A258_9HYME|nr:hypothetical protein WN51_11984 [Melipona quadrifasciata]